MVLKIYLKLSVSVESNGTELPGDINGRNAINNNPDKTRGSISEPDLGLSKKLSLIL